MGRVDPLGRSGRTSRSTSRAVCRRSRSGTGSRCATTTRACSRDAVGWVTVRTVDEVRTGDHTFFVGELLTIEEGAAETSLAYVHRGYVSL